MHPISVFRQPAAVGLMTAQGTPPPRSGASAVPATLPAPRGRALTRSDAPGLPPVSTVLTPNERLRVDAAGEGVYQALHRDSLDEVIRDLRERRVGAVLMSLARNDAAAPGRVATMVREFPRVRAVALLTQLETGTPRAALALGHSGVRTLVDARDPAGWRELRSVLAVDRARETARAALAVLDDDLADTPDDCRRFFTALFTCPARVTTVRVLSQRLGVLPSTLMSRFFRSRLPAPKRYLAVARLVRAARLFENSGLSIANVANQLDYSSPQSFGRHVRTLLRMTALEFRQQYDGDGMLRRFRDELVTPYRLALKSFRPLSAPPGWVPASSRRIPVSPPAQ